MTDPVRQAGRTLLTRFAGRLRFPQLFMLTASLFLVDLVVPDLFPFVDELLLGLATLLFANWKKEKPELDHKPPMKDITPPE